MKILDEIRSRSDIVEVVSSYVSLKKAGRSFRGLCPFHAEKTPSFFVFPERQSWHCFGACNVGGDVFSFIIKREGLDFTGAMHFLADKAGIVLNRPSLNKEEEHRYDRLVEINEIAAEFYHYYLTREKHAETTRGYLKKRGLAPESISDFQIGMSTGSDDAMRTYLSGKGYETEELIKAGVLLRRDDGTVHDRFRNRLMFPIKNEAGEVVGFGARTLDDSMPKYLNSAQSPIFDKGGILYGIDKAKPAIRQRHQVIVVEGYMDVIIAHQFGWENVLASMGTAITENQFNIIKSLSKNIILALDSDIAGKEATLRALDMLVKFENIIDGDIKVLSLPEGKDPDEVIKEEEPLWRNLVNEARTLLDYASDIVSQDVSNDDIKGKITAISRLAPALLTTKDPLRRAFYIQKLTRKLTIPERDVTMALKNYQLRQTRKVSKKFAEEEAEGSLGSDILLEQLEESFLSLLIKFPDLRTYGEEVNSKYFRLAENKEIFLKWLESPDYSSLILSLDQGLVEQVEYLKNKELKPPSLSLSNQERRDELKHCALRLLERNIKDLYKARGLLFLEPNENDTDAQVSGLAKQGQEEIIQLKKIFKEKQ